MEQEKGLLMTQNEWMTQELDQKSEKLIQLQKERSSIVGELESQLASKEEEVKLLFCPIYIPSHLHTQLYKMSYPFICITTPSPLVVWSSNFWSVWIAWQCRFFFPMKFYLMHSKKSAMIL